MFTIGQKVQHTVARKKGIVVAYNNGIQGVPAVVTNGCIMVRYGKDTRPTMVPVEYLQATK